MRSRWIAVMGLMYLIAGIAVPADADLTITMRVTQTETAPQNYPQHYSHSLKYTETEYVSGSRVRIEFGGLALIGDTKNHKLISLDSATKTYCVSDLTSYWVNGMFSDGSGAPGLATPDMASVVVSLTPARYLPPNAQTKIAVRNLGKSKTLLGHATGHYVDTSQPMGTNQRTEVYAAQDLPAQDTDAFNTLAKMATGQVHVVGVPLKSTTMQRGGAMPEFTVNQVATAISTKRINSSMFDIPKGYKEVHTPINTPTQNGVPMR